MNKIACAGCLIFRLSRPEAGSGKVVAEARAEGALNAQRWTCLALNVKEHVYKRRIHIQVGSVRYSEWSRRALS